MIFVINIAKKVRTNLSAALFSLLLMSVCVNASTLWISPTGGDFNPGTKEQPWLTPHKAAATAKAGDTVYFQPGTYNITSAIEIMNSGTADAWIVFSAAPGHMREAIINGGIEDGPKGAWFASGKSYIKLIGFTIQNVQPKGAGIWIRGREASKGTGSATGLRIENCRIHNTSNMGIAITGVPFKQDCILGSPSVKVMNDIIIENCEIEKTNEPDGKNECISVGEGVTNIIVRNNWIHDSDQYGIDFKEGVDGGEIYGNHIHGMEKHGIYMDAFAKWDRNIKIYNNLIHDCRTNGIVLARENWQKRSPELANIDIFNNIIFNCSRYGFYLYQHIADDSAKGIIDNITFANNTIYDCGGRINKIGGGIEVTHNLFSLSTVHVRNNIIWDIKGNVLETNPAVVNSNNLLDNENPKFVDEKSFNFHLMLDSPAIDTGTSEDAPGVDYDNNSRVTGKAIDIGAYEFVN